MSDIETFKIEAEKICARERFIIDRERLDKLMESTLGVGRNIAAAAFPASTREVVELVKLANRTQTFLYPVSRGRNVGYGDRQPVENEHVLVDLSEMDAVREYDSQLGQVVIEAGVTQQQLFEFLRSHDSPYWMDTTGAGKEASIAGNTLEGGFGHTPLGNHREGFTDAEIVLGDGTLLHTGRFPGLGPDLKGMFVQSNYGIVTAMRIDLFRAPEHFESFVLRTDDSQGLPELVDRLRILRQENVVTSCVHLANPMRYFISSRPFPENYRHTVMTDEDAVELMSSKLMPVGRWNAAGGLYGLRGSVEAHKRRIIEAFKGLASIKFFSDATVARFKRTTGILSRLGVPGGKRLFESLESFEQIHGLMKGIPSDEAYKNITWRAPDYQSLGLIWFAPTMDATGENAALTISLAQPLFTKYGFEMPVTMTLVTADRIVAIFNIAFDKTDNDQTNKAHKLYHALQDKFEKNGITTYRSSIMGMKSLRHPQKGRQETLDRLKRALDPEGVLAVKRYGIG